jgi:hypothetical protein
MKNSIYYLLCCNLFVSALYSGKEVPSPLCILPVDLDEMEDFVIIENDLVFTSEMIPNLLKELNLSVKKGRTKLEIALAIGAALLEKHG